MKTKQMGRTRLKVSEICLGTMTFGNQADEAASFTIMDVADQAGINFFDTADAYPLGGDLHQTGSTEVIVGNWLKARNARERIVLATKCRGKMGPLANDEGLSRKHILKACDDSLRRLQTDYIDLYQFHWPDAETPLEESLRAADDLVRSGKVRYLGVSNFLAWQMMNMLWLSDKFNLVRIECDQPRYNLLFRMIEDEIVPTCMAHGIGLITYNPLAGGMLTHRYKSTAQLEIGSRFALKNSGELYRKRYWNDAVVEEVNRLGDFFALRNKSLTHVALAWVLGRPGITSAILGASKPDQLTESLKGVGMSLDAEELAACDDAWFNLPKERDASVARR
jgi:aryl-alcohol dehydrogenase-like predicted oxidoreductase